MVRLEGEFDLVDAERVRATLVSTAGSTVLVDLSGLTFIDAAALSALMSARKQVEESGNQLVLGGARGLVRRVFSITGLDNVLDDQVFD